MPDFTLTPLELQFANALALIAAACVFAPVFRRLGLDEHLSPNRRSGFFAMTAAIRRMAVEAGAAASAA